MNTNVIEVKNLSKTFNLSDKNKNSIREKLLNWRKIQNSETELKALDDIEFSVKKGEFFGVIGRNGSGKSTLLRCLIGSIRPDKNSSIKIKGKMIRLALGMGFDPNLSARENIYVNGSILGLTFKRIGLLFDDIIGFAELDDFVDTPIKKYSSGMISKLKFSIAVHAEADIFLMDEFFGGVGDISYRKKSDKIFRETFLDGRTIIHVSHQLNVIRKYCDRVLLLNNGKQLLLGSPAEVSEEYLNLSRN